MLHEIVDWPSQTLTPFEETKLRSKKAIKPWNVIENVKFEGFSLNSKAFLYQIRLFGLKNLLYVKGWQRLNGLAWWNFKKSVIYMANYLHSVIILSFLGILLQIVLLANIFSFHHLSLAITLYHAVSSRQICVQVSEVLHRFHLGAIWFIRFFQSIHYPEPSFFL